MIELTGRVAVITGASRGLGAAMASHFLTRGLNVAACARTRPDYDDSEHSLSRSVDVTNASAVDAFCDEVAGHFGHIDLWINNAGLLAPIGPLRDNDPAEFARHIEVNVLGVFHGSGAYIRHIHAHGGEGVLINISSGAARSAYAGWSAYCSGKAAVDRMSEAIALEEGTHGVRVHSVAPGVIDTDMQSLIRASTPEQFPRVDKFLKLKETDSFSAPDLVAERLLDLAFDPEHYKDDVLVTLPPQSR
ncbi:MAG: SDR family NAD(P)-dependent oxidoreductase [Thiohalocapsa sp.]|nr:SDR family NAD(P)-dependent oxidoreductase [Thiohalocapsa sp.]MCF7992970.1 SDR family NAD(P)-dependent oxidoreductase [Thiohalocapsa sp.]